MLRQEGITPFDDMKSLAVALRFVDPILAKPFKLDPLGLRILQAGILDLGPEENAQGIDRLALHIDGITIQFGLQPCGLHLSHLGGL